MLKLLLLLTNVGDSENVGNDDVHKDDDSNDDDGNEDDGFMMIVSYC